jgi:urease alpha subunit
VEGPVKKVLLPIFVLLVLASSLVAQQNSAAKQKPLVFTHVTVIDVTGGPAQPDRTVVILGGHITEIGDSAKIVVPKDSQVVEAKGKFLIPGLWDMHVHWNFKDYLPLFIANGVTGIRQMSGTYDSLGEAYMANGDKELASKNYRKSLELNPKNTNAVEMLKKLAAE